MKKSISILLSFLLLVSLFSLTTALGTQAAGTTYYVDSVLGSDSNNGTSANSAWKTLNKVNSTTFSAGSKILFKRGGSWSGVLSPKGSGNASNYITISCYGDSSAALPVISNTTSTFTASDSGKTITATLVIYKQNYWKISDLELVGQCTSNSARSVVYIASDNGFFTNHITLSSCVIRGTNWTNTSSKGNGLTGVEVSHLGTYYGFFNDITIENNSIYDCNGSGITTNGSWGGCDSNGNPNNNSSRNIVIRNNYMTHIGQEGILVTNNNAPLVEYNTVEGSHASITNSWHVAIWPFSCYNALFQYNEAYNTKTTYDGHGFDCDYQCYGTTFQYNYGHDNEGGFMLICCEPTNWDGSVSYNKNVVVRYNIGQNNKNVQFALTGPISDTHIYNNTLYYKSGVTVSTYLRDGIKAPTNTYFTNNIFYNVNGGEYNLSYGGVSCKNTVWKNNLFYGKHPSNEPTGTGKLTSDPKFLNAGGASTGMLSCQAYFLKTGSPALNAGVAVTNPSAYPCTTDFFGNTIKSTPNIGAYGGAGYDGVNVTTATATKSAATERPTAATTTKPVIKPGNPQIVGTASGWYNGTYWVAPSGGSGYVSGDNVVVQTSSSTNTNLFQIGTWQNGGFSSANMQSAVGNEGVAVKVKIDRASSKEGTPTKLDVTVKLYLPDGGDTAYICYFNGVPVNGEEVMCYFPFDDFTYHTDPSIPMNVSQVGNITGLEVNIISDNSFDGKQFNNLKATISPLFIYDGEYIDPSQIPSSTTKTTTPSSTAKPTTPSVTAKPTASTTQSGNTPTQGSDQPTQSQTQGSDQPTQTTTQVANQDTTNAPTTAVGNGSQNNTVVTIAKKPVKVKGLKIKAGKKKVTVRWKAAKNAKNYIIRYSYKKSMKNSKYKTTTRKKIILKKLKSGKKIYIRVRGVNGKLKGKYSVRKYRKVK